MILVDANIWIDYLRLADVRLAGLLRQRRLLIHPYTRGEIALGDLADRAAVLDQLARISTAPTARHDEVMHMIETDELYGTGVGYVDCHLLASARLIESGKLWTRDKRLHAQAERLGVAFSA